MDDDVVELRVLNKKDLTNFKENVKKKDLAKYLDRNVINQRIPQIEHNGERMFITFLWLTGVRVSEALNIRKKDIDFVNNTIRISWLKSRKYKERNIPILAKLGDILRFYTGAMNLDDKLFPFTRQRAWQITKKWFNVNPHAFRHSFAVNYLRQGGRIENLHRLLGHKNISVTMEYLKIVPQDLAKELNTIEF